MPLFKLTLFEKVLLLHIYLTGLYIVPGGAMDPQILADKLTLSQPRGAGRLCPPNNTVTPGFSDLRPCLIYLLGSKTAVLRDLSVTAVLSI